jgi:hypothetical protein
MREYGIFTSEAHYWLHVCPLDASFYMYPRKPMATLLHEREFPTMQIKSAIGYLVDIRSNLRANGGIIRPLDLDYAFFGRWDWKAAESDEHLGRMAEDCFSTAVRVGLFTLPVRASFYTSRADQFKGKDFACTLAATPTDIEVKPDTPGGIWGTGNLCVQTHEGGHDHARRHAHRGQTHHDAA